MSYVYVSLGTNMGNREQNLLQARKYINNKIGKVTKVSSIYETQPWGFNTELMFYNQVVEVDTDLSPLELLHQLQIIEITLGRKEKSKTTYESRIIDLDILLYDDHTVIEEELAIPHKNLQNRKFELIPLDEIASMLIHPVYQITINELLLKCEDNSLVRKIIRN